MLHPEKPVRGQERHLTEGHTLPDGWADRMKELPTVGGPDLENAFTSLDQQVVEPKEEEAATEPQPKQMEKPSPIDTGMHHISQCDEETAFDARMDKIFAALDAKASGAVSGEEASETARVASLAEVVNEPPAIEVEKQSQQHHQQEKEDQPTLEDTAFTRRHSVLTGEAAELSQKHLLIPINRPQSNPAEPSLALCQPTHCVSLRSWCSQAKSSYHYSELWLGTV